jgi:predicted unusual protein kinase regulating ubiquinone biosynthesis (AarF/ABC1/UbiB family)
VLLADEILKGRIARGLALVKLAASELPMVAKGVLRRDDDQGPDLTRLKASAEHALQVLGDLRGLALKAGQTLSYVDGLLPPEAADVYQKALAKLQSGAPTVSFEQVRSEVERGIGKSLESAFARFEETPIAAASIGQVHRASLMDDGVEREVAVKVQYPSIAQALTSDLKNLDALRPMIAMMAPGADTRGGFEEVIEQIAAELDYNREARNQDMFREMLREREGAFVPRVFHSHTARNVITMEFVPGRSLRDVSEHGSQELRDAVGKAIFRYSLGFAIGRGVFNTDPHPGNYIVTEDGRVAFLDFGSVKVMPPDLRERWKSVALLLVNNRHDEWRRESAKLFGMEAMDPRARKHHQDFMLSTAAMVARDEEVTINREMLRGTVKDGVKTVKDVNKEMGWMAGRMQLGLFAVLAQLRPCANWNRILREELQAQ